ncbi:MFS transporter [Agaricicola taiwanensis]|nr:MFS transporter [Agaricicola taiwanensis]
MLARDFGIAADTVVFAMSAYQAAMVAALIPLATLADKVGHRRIYMAGMLVFVLGGLLCALSSSFSMLIMARGFQGLGAAGIMSVSIALVRRVYPVARMGRGMGINALTVSACLSIGPSLAMLIEQHASWHWLFIFNLMIGVAAFTAAMRTLPASAKAAVPIKLRSLLLVFCALSMLAIIVSGAIGNILLNLTMAAVALGLLAATARMDILESAPILATDLFRCRSFRLSSMTAVMAFAVHGVSLVALPFLLQERLAGQPEIAGLILGLWPACMAIAAPVAGSLSDRIRPAIIGSGGLCILALGLAAVALSPLDITALDFAWRIALCGLGFGLFQSPNLRALMHSAPLARSGAASGIVAGSRLLGQLSGAGLCSYFFAVQMSGVAMIFWISVGLTIVGLMLSLARLASTPRTR